MTGLTQTRLGVMTIAWLALSITSCDTNVDLLTENGTDLFALHGFVNTEADTQYVRIESLRPLVVGTARDMNGVTVRSIRLDTGAEVAWEYAPETIPGGQVAHVYRAGFRAQAGTTYRIDVERDGLPGATASAQVPPLPRFDVAPPVVNDGSFVAQTVTVSGVVGSPLGVRLVYYLVQPGSAETRRLEVDYGEPPESQGGRFIVTTYPGRDLAELLFRLGLPANTRDLALVRIALEYELLSPEWTSRDQDPGIVIGHGFFAARGVYESSWRLDGDTVRLSGFVDAQAPA